jgi:hypothetical protein
VKRSVRVVLITAALASCPWPARAQQLEPPRRRQGYYVAGGLGVGLLKSWDEGAALPLGAGGKIELRAGQLLTPRFGLGLDVELGGGKRDAVSTVLFGLGFEAHLALVDNLAMRVGVGLAGLSIDDSTIVDDLPHGAYGSKYAVGLSYDWFPFRRANPSGGLAVTPVLQLRALPESSAANLSLFLGFEIAWWTGLPHHQLDLPDRDAYQKSR